MVKGTKKQIQITKDLIINKIGAYAIYSYYIPGLKVGVPMCSPLRKERNASFVVKQSSNSMYHKDYGASEFDGTCIDLVCHLFGLTYKQALNKIGEDFGLLAEEEEYELKVKEIVKMPKKKKTDIIQVKSKPLGKEHLKYLSDFHISPNSLDIFPDVKIVAVKEWALNRAKMPLRINEVAFAYVVGDKVKIYRPEADKENKWKSTLPFRYIMGLSNIEGKDFGIITKSVKDALTISEHVTKNVCCVQGEDSSCITDENIEWINSVCKKVYLNFDSDNPGKKNSHIITKKTGWSHINVPDNMLGEGIKDFADFCKIYGPEALKAYFKSKIKEL